MVSAMARVVRRHRVDAARLAQLQAPRTAPFREQAAGDGSFVADDAVVRGYRRTLAVTPLDDGRARVVERTEFRLAIPYFGWLLLLVFVPALRRPPWKGDAWWLPPTSFDERAITVLATMCAVAVVYGYVNTLFNQTVAFAADEFHASDAAQGIAGSVLRVGGLLALFVAAQADRRGRRRVILWTTAAMCVSAVSGALAPSLSALTGTQVVASAFCYGLLIVGTVMASEEVPADARALSLSLLAISVALGAGICVAALRLADLGVRAWRLVYVPPLFGLLLLPGIARRLPESKRFDAPHAEATMRGHGRRLWLLVSSLVLVNLFVAPDAQFFNRFLRHERHYTGGGISLISLGSGTPGALGVIAGGALADRRGRRGVAAFSLVVGAGATLSTYFVAHSALWATATVGSILFGASVPALGVYGPELFPTSLRARSNAMITVAGLVGSVVGLVAVGGLADRFGRIGPAMAIVAAGPIALAVLVLAAYPETAGAELETLNPEDAEDGSGARAGPTPSP